MGEPRSWGEFMEALVKLIGQAADTGGSQTAGTVFGKENAILGILKNGGMPMVKSIQWGFSSLSVTKNISISPVDVNKSLAFVFGMTYSTSPTHGCYLSNFESESIRVTGEVNNDRCSFNWYVVEFH